MELINLDFLQFEKEISKSIYPKDEREKNCK